MVTFTIGSSAGNYGFSVEDFSLKMTGDYMALGFSTLKYGDNKHDYVELRGKFNYSNGLDADSVVRSITSLKLVTNDKTMLSASGLDIGSADVETKASRHDYFNSQAYIVEGNNSANVIATADKADKVSGAGGNDTISGNGGADKLYGGLGRDILSGGNQDDQLFGDDGDDRLDGGDGKDRLAGGLGKDTLRGGAGNDSYVIDKSDTISETRTGGIDTVSFDGSIDLRKFANIENLVLTGNKAITGTGDGAANSITGNSAANVLWGGKGADSLKGGAGADTFHFVRGDGRDTIVDFDATGHGQDHIDLDDYGTNLKYRSLDIDKLGKYDVDIDFGNGDHLVLKHVNIGDIDARDFLF